MAFTAVINCNALSPWVGLSGYSPFLHNGSYKINVLSAKKSLFANLQLQLPLCIFSHCSLQQISKKKLVDQLMVSINYEDLSSYFSFIDDSKSARTSSVWIAASVCSFTLWLASAEIAHSSEHHIKFDDVYDIGAFLDFGVQLTYLLLLLALLGFGAFFVIQQVLVRRELDLSAKELQEQVRSGAGAVQLFELGAVMLRRKFYPAATRYLLEAIDKWDGDSQDLAQVHNALGVSYVRDGKLDKGITQFEKAVKLLPGYVTAWNNLGDAYEQVKDLKSALGAFEEALLFDPNNKVANPRRDALKDRVELFKGVTIKTKRR